MDTILSLLQQSLSGIGPLFILLGLLIFVHELGHFLVAKFYGVRVEVFSLGFGKKILQTKRGDTTYCVAAIPLGGYVKMFGDDPTKEVDDAEKKYSFLDKPVHQRIAIVLAGPLMNLFFAALLFFCIALVGQETPGPYLGDVGVSSDAYKAGFRSGDKITAVNAEPMESWKALSAFIQKAPNKELKFQVIRENTNEKLEVITSPKLGISDDVLESGKAIGKIDGFSLESMAPVVGVPRKTSLAAQAGFQSLDIIKKIDGAEILNFRSMKRAIWKAYEQSKTITVEVSQYDADKQTEVRELKIEPIEKLFQNSDELIAGLGFERAELYLLKVKPDGPADQGGLQRGDKILSIQGEPIAQWQNVVTAIKNYEKDSGPISVGILRKGAEKILQVSPQMTELLNSKGQDEERFTVGIYPAYAMSYPPMILEKTTNLFEATRIGIDKSFEWSGIIAMGFVKMVQGDVSAKNIGSLITIGRYASHSFEAGLSQFLRMMAIISINLFLINLLPVPVLDGGHLVFFTIEALRGAPLSMRKMEIAQQFGLVVLMSLMAFALFNDITNWFAAW